MHGAYFLPQDKQTNLFLFSINFTTKFRKYPNRHIRTDSLFVSSATTMNNNEIMISDKGNLSIRELVDMYDSENIIPVDVLLLSNPNVDDGDIALIGERFGRLKQLQVKGGGAGGLTSAIVTGSTFDKLPATLCQLALVNCPKVRDAGLVKISKLKRLERLSVVGCDGITGATLELLPDHLDELELLDCINLKDEGLNGIQKLSMLTCLTVEGCPLITMSTITFPKYMSTLNVRDCDNVVDTFMSGLKHLSFFRNLTVSRCDKITGSHIDALPKSTGNVVIYDCNNIVELNLMKLDRLKELVIFIISTKTPVSKAIMKHLRESIPNLYHCDNYVDGKIVQ